MKVVIGADHAGYVLKENIKTYLNAKDIAFTDIGTFKEESVDYPEFAYKVGNAILKEEADMGILICGTGIGMSISANKIKGIRAALVHNKETAELSRLHNNANVLCIGSRQTEKDTALELLDAWLNTSFEGGRHEKRIDLINKLTGL
ncbi:MAG: ribose 5-phosphate isomerase B [Calditrichaeota bacterium]|nr:MAG: ribose 5-phosphate isomerase B [Calditrichota bacterium]MBL1205471.1 ribose 5-phosphate isomerase B [Calditrichota bacterium]NOG45300.1 ribose 5-phosphate isomerase B [Calditrichota bacterium]